jgi:microcompartment protein CcmK/EutM
MTLGKVVGTVVATQKDQGLAGYKLQIVQSLELPSMKPKNSFLVAIDSVGAGDGEVVLCCSGSSARMTSTTENRPVDAVIVAIVDTAEIDGSAVYQKSNT